MRSNLPDDVLITFTHGDLHPSNIIVSPEGEPQVRVLAIIDWHQSGWFPACWEYCKARWTTAANGEWAAVYLPRILETFESYFLAWDYLVLKLGL